MVVESSNNLDFKVLVGFEVIIDKDLYLDRSASCTRSDDYRLTYVCVVIVNRHIARDP